MCLRFLELRFFASKSVVAKITTTTTTATTVVVVVAALAPGGRAAATRLQVNSFLLSAFPWKARVSFERGGVSSFVSRRLRMFPVRHSRDGAFFER